MKLHTDKQKLSEELHTDKQKMCRSYTQTNEYIVELYIDKQIDGEINTAIYIF